MNGIIRIAKESRVLYYIFGIAFIINAVSIVLLSNVENKVLSGSPLFFGTAMGVIACVALSGLTVVNLNYKLSRVFNTNSNKSTNEIVMYMGVICAIAAILLNLVAYAEHFLPNTPLVGFIAGYNWNILDKMMVRIIIVFIGLYTIGIGSMLITSIFNVYKAISGLTAITVVLSVLAIAVHPVNDFLLWGMGSIKIYVTMVVISAVSTVSTKKILVHYEVN